jgi:hypothetical protein
MFNLQDRYVPSSSSYLLTICLAHCVSFTFLNYHPPIPYEQTLGRKGITQASRSGMHGATRLRCPLQRHPGHLGDLPNLPLPKHPCVVLLSFRQNYLIPPIPQYPTIDEILLGPFDVIADSSHIVHTNLPSLCNY